MFLKLTIWLNIWANKSLLKLLQSVAKMGYILLEFQLNFKDFVTLFCLNAAFFLSEDTILLTTKSLRVPNTHLVYLGGMKG